MLGEETIAEAVEGIPHLRGLCMRSATTPDGSQGGAFLSPAPRPDTCLSPGPPLCLVGVTSLEVVAAISPPQTAYQCPRLLPGRNPPPKCRCR